MAGRRGKGTDLSLDGEWEIGIDRDYTAHTLVPGLAQDPAKPSPGTLWYRRQVLLPQGNWRQAVLTLKGARFAPEVYLNGQKVSSAAGGMAPTVHLLRSVEVVPGATVELEIALKSLNVLDPTDASMVPQADTWRTNVSSGLWDSVTLHFAGASIIIAMTPFSDWAGHNVAIHWATSPAAGEPGKPIGSRRVRVLLLDDKRRAIAQSAEQDATSDVGTVDLHLGPAVASWSPEHPVVYKLRLVETEGGELVDAREISWGWKEFHTQDKRLYLNGQPVELRGGTVMWHRFLRNPEAKAVAFDPEWFRTNVVLRLKSHGANLLRFNLGLPPESLLDLCDHDGLMVQMEWPFLHGIKASEQSLREQWHAWLDVAMRHPSVMIIHPWNETEGDDLKIGWKAINAVLADYPPLVVAHRDTVQLHKFWWSFENLGLYYDSADQFDRTVMADEFGGNYLDQDGNPGSYPANKETFLRYLGRNQTRDLRLELNAESNARVAEYWRRIGVAGFSPFCILGSPFDGSSWFLGHLAKPQLMPVWDALTAAWSPQSVSLDVWDRNYLPGQRVEMPVFFFNDTDKTARLNADVRIVSVQDPQRLISVKKVEQQVAAHTRVRTTVSLVLPPDNGEWRFEAELKNTVPGVTHPIVSSWMFRTLPPSVPQQIAGIAVGVPEQEAELRAFLT
jgi:beta-galactosidase